MSKAKEMFKDAVDCFCDRLNEGIAEKVYKGELYIIKTVPESICKSKEFKSFLKDYIDEGFEVISRESKEHRKSYVVKISWDV